MMIEEGLQQAATQKISQTNKTKIGFLGIDWIGKLRVEALRSSHITEVAAVCDPFNSDIEKFCKECGVKNVNTYEELLEENIEGVVIATPNTLHKEQVMQGLKKGKAVLCQKPLACSLPDTQEVLETAKQNNCLLMTDFSYQHTNGLKKIRGSIEAGELGDVYALNFIFHNPLGPSTAWYYNPSVAGGGCMMDIGVHLLEILYWIFPHHSVEKLCSNLFAHGKPLHAPGLEGEDYASVHINFTGGLTAQLCCSWNLPAGEEAQIELNFYGTKGGASFRNTNGSLYDFKAVMYKGMKCHILSLPPDDWGGRASLHWASLLSKENRYVNEVDNYLKIAQTLDLIYAH